MPIVLTAILAAGIVGAYFLLGGKKPCMPSATEQLPNYILELWPAPEATITMKCYNSTSLTESGPDGPGDRQGIGAWVSTGDIDEFVADADFEPLPARIRLVVDGRTIPGGPTYVWDDLSALVWIRNGVRYSSGESGSYKTGWKPALEPGEHEAQLVFLSNTGKVFEYSWRFRIK
ncbi:MAG: hypothetical protein AB1894_15130 [Chloroflexota bacterium]